MEIKFRDKEEEKWIENVIKSFNRLKGIKEFISLDLKLEEHFKLYSGIRQRRRVKQKHIRKRIQSDCPICLEKLNEGKWILDCHKECGTTFHKFCLFEYIRHLPHDMNLICPSCDKEMV
jgi:hypothetical protein